MPSSARLRELAEEALTNLNARKPSRLGRTKDAVALVSSLLGIPTALISVLGLLQQTQRANIVEQQKSNVVAIANSHLQETQSEVQQLKNSLVDLKKEPAQTNTAAIDQAIDRADTIQAGVATTQTQLRTAAVAQQAPQQQPIQQMFAPTKNWQVVIGDYADLNEAQRKQDAASKIGYDNSEIYGDAPHLHMRFIFPTKEDATAAAEKIKAARIGHEPDVLPYRAR
jgi:hypothetical protein